MISRPGRRPNSPSRTVRNPLTRREIPSAEYSELVANHVAAIIRKSREAVAALLEHERSRHLHHVADIESIKRDREHVTILTSEGFANLEKELEREPEPMTALVKAQLNGRRLQHR